MAFKLAPPTEQEKWFEGSSMFTGILDDSQKLFLGGVDDPYVKMIFPYGIEGINRDYNPNGKKFSIYEPNDNRGTVVYNTNFDITNAQTQTDVLNGCQLLRDAVCDKQTCADGKLVRTGGVTCFLEEVRRGERSKGREERSDNHILLKRND